MIKYKKYFIDDLQTEDPSKEELRRKKIEQAAIRLEQREHRIRLQEEKRRLLEEKRRIKEIERRKDKLKNIFRGFLKGVVSLGTVATTILGLMTTLGEFAQTNPVADRIYSSCMRILEQMLSAARHGGSLARSAFVKVFEKITSANRRLLEFIRERFSRVERNNINDSNTINRYKKNNRLKRLCGKRYKDIIGMPIVVGVLQKTILPLLISLLKAGAIAGIAKSIAGPVEKNVTGPIISRIINNIKMATIYKGDKTYTEALLDMIKSDMNTLMNIIKNEKSFIADKLRMSWDRIKAFV